MDIWTFFWTFYLNHLIPLWGYFFTMNIKGEMFHVRFRNRKVYSYIRLKLISFAIVWREK